MGISIKEISIITLLVVVVWFLASGVRVYVLNRRAGQIIAGTTPFHTSGQGQRILILGDSLAYGTGTSQPENSIAGLFAAEFDDPTVQNLAKNGKRTNELAQEIKTLKEHYDLILIIIGGNDIIRPYIDLGDSGDNLQTIYSHASEHADNVVALTTGNLKYTSFFLPPLRQFIGNRSVQLRDSAVASAQTLPNVTYVDLVAYNEIADFDADKEAKDKLHLSDEGARYWLNAIKASTNDLQF